MIGTRSYRYLHLDVFTDHLFGGNQLAVVLDGREGRSYLLVLDAKSLKELGRARVPHHIPFGFHGQYFS